MGIHVIAIDHIAVSCHTLNAIFNVFTVFLIGYTEQKATYDSRTNHEPTILRPSGIKHYIQPPYVIDLNAKIVIISQVYYGKERLKINKDIFTNRGGL